MAGGGGRGGIALDFRRGETAKQRLEIDWKFPVWKPKGGNGVPRPGETTVSVEREHALPIEQAYELATDGDRRPMLVMRECDKCKGTDHALLSRSLDNEQTVLLTHWFRCVKVPTNVLDTDHPLYTMFARTKEGERIPHLFFCDPDGSNKVELPGDQPQAELWKVMFSYLDRCYDGNAKASLKEMRALLSQFDKVDSNEVEIKGRIDREVEKNGPDSKKIEKYEADLEELRKEREQLFAREKKIRELALKDLAEGGKPTEIGAASGEK